MASARTGRSRASHSSCPGTRRTLTSSPSVSLFPFPLSSLTIRAVLVRLGVQVDWEDEKACFDSFLRELAFFYIPGPTPSTVPSEDPEKDAAEKRVIQHVVFPAAKQYLVPPERLLKRDFVQVTSLESLYRVCVVFACGEGAGADGDEQIRTLLIVLSLIVLHSHFVMSSCQ